MKIKLLFSFLLIHAFLIASAVTPPIATISYNSPIFCTNSTLEFAILIGTTGGTFSASPSGLSINAVTGDISPSQSALGTYTVTYDIPAGVDPAFSTTTTIIITPEVVPLFQAASITICEGSTPPPLFTTSYNGITGTWSPAVVDTTMSGVYIFTPNAGQCAVTTTMNIIVRALPTAMISASGDIVNFIGTPNASVTYIYNGGAYQIIALDSTGTAAFSLLPNSVPATICLVSAESNGILNCTAPLVGCATVLGNNQFDFNDLTFGPNPVADVLHVESKDMIKDVTVFNIMGQKILQQHFDSLDLRLSLSQLKTGNYFIKLESNNKSQVIKVIKE